MRLEVGLAGWSEIYTLKKVFQKDVVSALPQPTLARVQRKTTKVRMIRYPFTLRRQNIIKSQNPEIKQRKWYCDPPFYSTTLATSTHILLYTHVPYQLSYSLGIIFLWFSMLISMDLFMGIVSRSASSQMTWDMFTEQIFPMEKGIWLHAEQIPSDVG